MKLEILNEKEYDKFALKHKDISIYQLSSWGKLKNKTGWKSHLVGFKENNKIVCATLLLEKSTPIKKSLFYAPRGFLIDSKDFELLNTFTKEVIDYIKSKKGFMLKIDPNVIYKVRNNKNEVIENCEEEFNNYKNCGFKHFGFTEDFETLQPRNLCRFTLSDTYEKTLETFQKSTRKNVLKAESMGVKTEVIKDNEIDEFMRLLNMAGDKNDFIVRPKWYYELMRNLFKNEVTFYLTYLDTKDYLQYLKNKISDIKKDLEELKIKFEKYNVGDKLKKEKETLESSLTKYKELLKTEKEKYKNIERINIGALMSVFTGSDGITFMSGTDPKYKNFYPKYSYYNEHIKDTLKRNLKYVNFYGISGNLDPNSKYYSIYEIKKGFNPDVIELLGEFDYIINKVDYNLYKLALKAYRIIKKIKH